MSDTWIAVDWGTSNLRAWRMRGADMLEARTSDAGMAQLDPDGFEPALNALCDGWLPAPVMACGMVGSRQGWVEAPYLSAPCVPPNRVHAVCTPGVRDVYVLPGVSQDNPADVMRGEETQIAGLLAARPNFDGVACLPGTHSKWVRISAGEIVSFQTFMTGELFQLLAGQSVLSHSIGAAGWDDVAFAEAVDDGMSNPAKVAARLFSLRAEALLKGLHPGQARARLSGLLIGQELGGARPYWLGQEVVVIGSSEVGQAYAKALEIQGVSALVADAEATTRAGLWAAWEHAHA
ncbi:MAG: 2-dehydro-3-deoxygalactonokinase [Pseudomonadota bacterium]